MAEIWDLIYNTDTLAIAKKKVLDSLVLSTIPKYILKMWLCQNQHPKFCMKLGTFSSVCKSWICACIMHSRYNNSELFHLYVN